MHTKEITDVDFIDGNISILDLLVKSKLCPSKGEARRLVIQGGVSVNDEKIETPTKTLTKNDFTDNFIVIKKGKKVFHKIVLG